MELQEAGRAAHDYNSALPTLHCYGARMARTSQVPHADRTGTEGRRTTAAPVEPFAVLLETVVPERSKDHANVESFC